MTPEERTVLHQAFAKTTDLFKRRGTARDWSDNIIEGSNMLTTAITWKHYYVWLANPNKYNEEAVDCMKVETATPECIQDYPECMKVETFQNGNETLVHVTNSSLHSDEKVES